jgi:peptide methionine sulfoxide reductase msrA/msrB
MPEMWEGSEQLLMNLREKSKELKSYARENKAATVIFTLLLGLAAMTGPAINSIDQDTTKDSSEELKADWKAPENGTLKNATFAGGCFWCTEAAFEGRKGVKTAVSGYAGGKESTARYELVASGKTKHREAARIRYYPSLISYEELLDIYWRSIDPTDPGGQFADRGFQYTTAIYAHSERQYRLAMESRENLSESGKFDEQIVTKVLNRTTFFPAEDYHQNYSRRNTMMYETYETASGREGYLEETWEN